MDGRSHECDIIVTAPDELEARVAALTNFLLALWTSDHDYLTQALPSREAKETADGLGVLPLSRTSIARIGNAVGARWEANRLEGETHVISEFEVPIQATAVSVSTDR